MTQAPIKNKIVSTRVTANIQDRARKNLADQGLTVSEYIRLALVKAANNEVQLVNFLDSSEALEAKKEAETDQLETIGDLNDFNDWIEKINED